MEDTTKVNAESTMPEADSEEAVSEVDKKVKVPKSKRFGKKESAKQPVKDKLKADKPKVVKSKPKKPVKNKDISNDNNTSNEYRQLGLKMSIKARLIASSVLPTVVGITVVLIIAIVNMSAGMNAEASNGLVLLAEATKSSYDNTYSGDWRVDNNGNIFKGDTNLSQKQDGIDKFTDDNDANITIFYGVDSKVTSLRDSNNKRMLSLKAPDSVWEKVKTGETYKADHIDIDGVDYTGVYLPLKNYNGNIVGMLFAGEPRTAITSFIIQKVIALVGVTIIVLLVIAVITLMLSRKIANALVTVNRLFVSLSNGDLTMKVDPNMLKRNDEIGEMAGSVQALISKLNGIVTGLTESADQLYKSGDEMAATASQSSKATEEISSAVEDISKGAVSQAEEIQNASSYIANMGKLIEDIVEKVSNLTQAANVMGNAGDTSMNTMVELSESNDHTTEAVNKIADQIELTNESVGKIGEAAAFITNIADQTSLLALNASIESARAGEAGKGFAVVASEIQKLASQSDEAAGEIKQIIENLKQESEKTVEEMNSTKLLINEQVVKLNATRDSFVDVSDGINVSRQETAAIEVNVGSCDDARQQVNDVIANLSAISEQNAASAEETTASMQELTATISMLSTTANDLMKISEKLNSEMKFFKI
mgnify:FL=1